MLLSFNPPINNPRAASTVLIDSITYTIYSMVRIVVWMSSYELFYPSAWVDQRAPLGVKENITG